MVNLGSPCAQHISTSLKPNAGSTIWVCDVLLSSVEIWVGSLIHVGSFTFADTCETLLKVDGISDDCALCIPTSLKPNAGSTIWVCDVLLSSVEIWVGSLIHVGSFTFADTCETLLKVDGISDDWRKVKSWLMNFRHLSSPLTNSVKVWSLEMTSGE